MFTTSLRQHRCLFTNRALRSLTCFFRDTVVHAGFGVFNDIIPQQIADNGLINAPNDPSFTGGIGGQVGGLGIAPGVTGQRRGRGGQRQQVVSDDL